MKGPPHNATHEQVRAAALRLFAARGFEATGIRAIAQEVGLTPAALYYYGSKEELLVAIMQDGLDELLGMANKVLASGASPVEQLQMLVRHHVEVHAISREAALVADTELRALSRANRKMIVARRDEYERVWKQVLQRGVEKGDFSIDDLTVTRLSLLEMCTGVAAWYLPHGRLSVDQIAANIARVALRVVGYSGPEPAPGGGDANASHPGKETS